MQGACEVDINIFSLISSNAKEWVFFPFRARKFSTPFEEYTLYISQITRHCSHKMGNYSLNSKSYRIYSLVFLHVLHCFSTLCFTWVLYAKLPCSDKKCEVGDLYFLYTHLNQLCSGEITYISERQVNMNLLTFQKGKLRWTCPSDKHGAQKTHTLSLLVSICSKLPCASAILYPSTHKLVARGYFSLSGQSSFKSLIYKPTGGT